MLLIDPLTIIGRVNYAEALGWQGQLEQAHDLADQVLAQSPELSYYAHAMVSMFCEGKIAEGLSWSLRLDEVVRTDTANYVKGDLFSPRGGLVDGGG